MRRLDRAECPLYQEANKALICLLCSLRGSESTVVVVDVVGWQRRSMGTGWYSLTIPPVTAAGS